MENGALQRYGLVESFKGAPRGRRESEAETQQHFHSGVKDSTLETGLFALLFGYYYGKAHPR